MHVVLGANEAGKTTVLDAIADLLFGFGHQTNYDFQHDGKLLRIGAELQLADGRRLSFRRRKGNKNTLIDAHDQPLADDFLGAMTGSLARESFCREFGLTAEALRKGGEDLLRAGGRLAETLAAGSAGLSELSSLRARLDDEAEGLFTSRKASAKPFYAVAERHADAERRLRDAIVTAEQLQAATDRIADARKNQDELVRLHEQAGRDLHRLQRCSRTRNGLTRLDGLQRDLEAFAQLPLVSAQIIAGWRTAYDADRDAVIARRGLDEADARDHAAIAALRVDQSLLKAGDAVDSLRERLGAVSKAMDDLPRRLEARRQAQSELDDLARRLGLAGHDVLLARRPADPALARVRDLADIRARLEERRTDAETRVRAATRTLGELQTPMGIGAHPTDPAVFGQRLRAFSHVPDDAKRLARETAECEVEFQRLLRRTQGLSPAVQSTGRLATLPLPDEPVIGGFSQAFADLDRRQQKAVSDVAAAERSIRDRTAEITRFAADGVRATRADLALARGHRDAAFVTLHAALDGDSPARHAAFDDLHGRSRAADEAADLLLSDSERAAWLEAAFGQRADAERLRADAVDERDALNEHRATHEARWRDLWAPTGLVPHSPDEMAAWRQRVREIVDGHDKLEARRGVLAGLAKELAQAQMDLRRFMEDHGRKAGTETAADLLYREASEWQTEQQQSWTAAREREVARKAAADKLAEAQADVDQAARQLDEIASQWPGAVVAIGLADGVSAAEAVAALGVWQHVGEPNVNLENATRSIDGIERDIEGFNADVSALAAAVAAETVNGDARSFLQGLVKSLDGARAAAGERDGLRKAIAQRQPARAGLDAKRRSLDDVLSEARQHFPAGDGDALASAIEQLEERQRLLFKHSDEAEKLRDSADGLDVDALRAEQLAVDPDVLPGDIARLHLETASLLTKIGEASVGLDRAQTEHDDLCKGRDAVGAARDREEAAAELLAISRRWLVRAVAARLAARAIERYRKAVQDPLLTRAGQLFQKATGDAFLGLTADYDRNDLPELVAVRASGMRVPIPGLSEGTRDQLFLSLRLALLELRAAEPMPFIADDLLSSFDDPRTANVLELLAEFGRRSQVIVFTHHEQVANLAQSRIPGAEVTLLN